MYYSVAVASPKYHQDGALTYSSEATLLAGTVVSVPLMKQTVPAIVLKKVTKPTFKTKPINEVIADSAITSKSLKLADWLRSYYPAPAGMITSLFVPSYVTQPSSESPINFDAPIAKVSLNDEQQRAVDAIKLTKTHSVLLHGDTGSGKTRVYLELARQSVMSNKSAIVLTPEIGLTPQLINDFKAIFGNRVHLLHSGLSAKKRRQTWLDISASQEPVVVIGPRSSLFAPVKSLGLVVVDEMHDTSYKQEQAPYYQATRVAAKLAELHGAVAVFGSATPSVQDYYVFEQALLPIVRMTKVATGSATKPELKIIDVKDRAQFTSSAWLSVAVIEAVKSALGKNEQSLLFLNRRGTARVILCQHCGWQATCPRCDVPLTYHGDSHMAVCHTCGYKQPSPHSCPTCQSTELLFKSAGTKTIVDEVIRLFPGANVKRFDSDQKSAERFDKHFSDVVSGKIDVLIGTQMLAKGLDLPRLSVVGVLQADTGLNFPDFTAEERTFQMLNQVVGRVGRGHRNSTVVIQTYNPLSKLIEHAITKDYNNFYKSQLQERKLFGFPPFCHLLKLTCGRRSQQAAYNSAQALAKNIADSGAKVEVVGPSPAFISKINNSYRWQLVLKAKNRTELVNIIRSIPSGWLYDIDPTHLL